MPVYAEARAEPAAPEYQIDADGHTQAVGSAAAESWDGRDTMQNMEQTPSISTSTNNATLTAGNTAQPPAEKSIADGKTATEIIAEAKAKPKQKMTWKEKFSKGGTMAMLGGNS